MSVDWKWNAAVFDEVQKMHCDPMLSCGRHLQIALFNQIAKMITGHEMGMRSDAIDLPRHLRVLIKRNLMGKECKLYGGGPCIQGKDRFVHWTPIRLAWAITMAMAAEAMRVSA